jgi:hypothetical protein
VKEQEAQDFATASTVPSHKPVSPTALLQPYFFFNITPVVSEGLQYRPLISILPFHRQNSIIISCFPHSSYMLNALNNLQYTPILVELNKA